MDRGAWICVAYGTVSVSLVMFNKAVFSYFHFGFPLSLFVIQMVLSLSILVVLQATGRINLPKLEWSVARQLAPMSICWWLYGFSGVVALQHLNVPMFSATRRLTPMIVMLGERLFLGRSPPLLQFLAGLAMCLSATAASLTDITGTATGYFWVLVCVAATAGYLLLIAKLGKPAGLSEVGLLFYNNLIALPFMLSTWWFSSESSNVLQDPALESPLFVVFFFVAAGQALLLNYMIFLCTLVNSPLATSITGNIKDMVTTSLGLFVFGDVVFTAPNMLSVVAGLLAAAWYSYLKYRQGQEAKSLRNEREKAKELQERSETAQPESEPLLEDP